MKELSFAIFGTGFWSQFQLAAWRELQGARCVALYNRTRAKAEALAQRFGVPAVYHDPEALLDKEQLDFVDIVTDVGTHAQFVELAAARKLAAICQKPMAPSLEIAQEMVETCRRENVFYAVHENWRWQTPLRELKRVLDAGDIGHPFRARVDFITVFPVFNNQPFLRTLEKFVLTDIGSHILDTARFLFGEARTLYCCTRRVHRDIQGEDVATVLMEMGPTSVAARSGETSVVCQMAYAENYLEHDRFPETYVMIEGERGSVELGPDYWLRLTTKRGTLARRCPPPRYAWADPAYDLVQASIVPCHANLLAALQGQGSAETSGEDNLKTVKLVFAAYESARTGRAIHFDKDGEHA